MQRLYSSCLAGIIFLLLCAPTLALAETIVIRDARVFDGVSDQLSEPSDVLVVDGVIDSIGQSLSVPDNTAEIDARRSHSHARADQRARPRYVATSCVAGHDLR